MKLKKWELALIMALGITLLSGAGLLREQSRLADRLIRLHVVANSDCDTDQALKLLVRDRMQAELQPLLDGVYNRGEAAHIIGENMDSLTRAAAETVAGHGIFVNLSLGVGGFPLRQYETFTLPAGRYKALRVELGEGKGENWWCVVFPPLCAESSVRAAAALDTLPDDQVSLITSDDTGHVIKFRSLEWIERVRSLFG